MKQIALPVFFLLLSCICPASWAAQTVYSTQPPPQSASSPAKSGLAHAKTAKSVEKPEKLTQLQRLILRAKQGEAAQKLARKNGAPNPALMATSTAMPVPSGGIGQVGGLGGVSNITEISTQ